MSRKLSISMFYLLWTAMYMLLDLVSPQTVLLPAPSSGYISITPRKGVEFVMGKEIDK